MIGTTLAHYRITAALGAGGMGEVWRAHDEKLGREVALKVLPEEFSDDRQRLERFEREARAVAALNHPHIVTIHSVEEVGGVHFLTMELVDGHSLDKLIPKGGLDLEKFFELASPLAEAISAAHDKSVIHRDLKPANVMVDAGGRLKVLDFGLAKLQDAMEPSESSELPTEVLTGIGTIVGTVPYMSPEQIEGTIVDHRTDIFSLGVMLYEMATGERPFQGSSSPALMSSILKDAPPSVVELRTDFPRHLGRVIGRCLEKDRRDRYQTARDVFNELRALRRESNSMTDQPSRPVALPPRPAPRPSSSSSGVMRGDVPWIAVLPFGCPSGDSNVEAFADGLEEDVASSLSRFSYLFVVARKSTGRYRGEAIDVRQVGEELGARFVMEGGIRKAGSTIRINVQIVDTETGTHLWAETYDRDLDETAIFAIQDDITDRVVATVADPYGVVARSMAIPTGAMKPEEMTAYQAVLRYFLFQQRLSQEDHLIAREALERAVEIEPGYADAWCCLALVVLDEDRHDFNRRPDALDRALSAARRGVESDPASSFAHYALATVYFYRRDLGSFRANAEKAIKLNRRNGNVVAMLGILYGYSGDWDRGVELTTEAMDLNPHHPGWYRFTTFFDHYLKGEFEEALRVAQKINMPGYYAAPMVELLAHKRLGNTAAAENAAREMLRAYPAEDMSGYGRSAEMWFYSQPDLLNEVISVLRSVGVEVDTPEALRPDTPSPVGLATRVPSPEQVSPPEESESVAIAVLPFSDLSPAKDQDWFCEGMAEEIMNALVRIEGIRVASRTSAFRVRQEGHGLAEIARLLSVGHVLEGSVRTGGSRLRVTAQLTDVASGYQLWSERFDRELEDVFAVQDEIAAGVVEAVEARLTPGARTIPARPQARNLEAYRSYLLGQHLRYAKEDHGGAVQAFREAVRLDPTHAPSWTGLAESLALSAHMSLIPAHEACADARKALSTALELQGESADGLHGEAFVAFIERRWTALEASVRRAIQLQPSHVPSLGLLGMCLCLHQKPDEAEPFFERARQADPLASFPYMLTALGLLTVRRPQEAHPYAEQALTFEKEDASALFCSSLANIALGHLEEGIEAAEHGVAVSHRGADFLGLLGWALATAGRKDEARTLLEELRARPAAAPPIVSEGWLLGALGKIDAAFEVLVRAENENQLWLYYTGLPGFDPLRADPRFDTMLERLGLPPSPPATGESSLDGTPAIAEKSIAVLPFTNMSADPDNEYFSDGLTEEIISDLSKIGALRVISRTSAMQFKGAKKNVQTIGRELGVRYVLEGGVRKAGSSLRITAQLIDAETDAHLWSEKYSGSMDDVFEVQERVSGEIVKALGVRLTTDENRRLAERPIANARAFELYLQARQEIRRFDVNALERAAKLLAQAVEIEGETPPLLNLMAYAKVAQVKAGGIHDLQQLDEAEAQALALLEHTPDLPQAHALLGGIAYERGRQREAVWHCRRALEGNSNDADALLYLGAALMAAGQEEEGLDAGRRMAACDPLASISWMILGAAYWFVDRAEEAVPELERSLELDPQNLLSHWAIGYTFATLGRLAEARRHADVLHENAPENPYGLQLLSLVEALEGRQEAALERLADVDLTPLDPHNIFHLSESFAMAGDTRRALEVLELAVDLGFYPYPFINEYCPFMAPLRSLPGFAPILAKSREKTESFREDGPLRPSSHDAPGGNK